MNWLKKLYIKKTHDQGLLDSILYNETTFYEQFIRDLLKAKEEVIIESPFITLKRLNLLMPVFEKLIEKKIHVVIITRDPSDNDPIMTKQAEVGIQYFENVGLQVLLVQDGHHRKLAMIDRKILWEGSLNILSQAKSQEFMRRIESKKLTEDLFKFLRLDKVTIFKKKLALV